MKRGAPSGELPFWRLYRAAGELFHFEAKHCQRGKVRHHTDHHHGHQTHQAVRHGALRPLRHDIQHANQRGRHHHYRNRQTQQEACPARLRCEDILLAQLPVQQPGVQTGRQTNRQ